MSWFNDAKYEEAKKVCDCEDGKFAIVITNIETDTTDYGRVLNVYFGIDGAKEWNGIPYKHVIYEGTYFDAKFSRLCDCFGVDFNANIGAFAKNDFRAFLNTTGTATFSHEKRKKVTDGFKSDGKPNEKFITEHSDFVQATLVPKAKAQNSTYQAMTGNGGTATTSKPIEQLSKEDEQKMGEIFGTGSNAPIY